MATVVKKNSFVSRLMNSVGAIFIGIILIIGCTIGLIWNEARSVKMIRAIDDVQKVMVEVGSAQAKSENEGKLVGVSGNLTFTTPGADSSYNITSDSFALIRIVEVYEWEETQKGSSTDEQTEYTYTLVWTATHINSSNFYSSNYANPAWPTGAVYQSAEFYSNDAKLGDFSMTSAQLAQLPSSTAIAIPSTSTMPESNFNTTSDSKYITNANPSNPQLGDIRISFTKSVVTQASALGKQTGTSLTDYITSNNVKINRVFSGIMTGPEMTQYLTEENTSITWILRILFMILICSGFAMLFTPIHVLIRIVPFLGKFLSNTAKGIAGLIGFVCGLTLSLVVIAVSWVAVRPIIGIPVLAVAIILIVLIVRYAKKKKSSAANEQTPA